MMSRERRRWSEAWAAAALGLMMVLPVRADVRLANVFSDHMVLQRGMSVTVWGTAQPGEAVVVSFAGTNVSATADAQGNWSVKLPALDACADGRELKAVGKTTVTLKDVLVGDVWLCSGQSNMAFPLGGCQATEDIRNADLPAIRYRGYWERFSGTPQADVLPGSWARLSPSSAAGCTAVGFYFARKVHREIGVPIGLLESTVGGTEIECWMSPQALREYPGHAAIAKRLDEAIDAYRKALAGSLDDVEQWVDATRKALAQNQPIPPQPRIPGHPNEDREYWVRIQSLYNGMIHPLTRFAIKGVLWYQGENNGQEDDNYTEKQRALVETWRRAWGLDFPFYYVQLANFEAATDNPGDGHGWPHCRMAQLKGLQLPKTGMAVTIDIGDGADIHPKNKQDVGERLALWALAKDYGKPVIFTGPLFKDARPEAGKMRVSFEPGSIGSGLMVGRKTGRAPVTEARQDSLKRFAVAGADKVWHWAQAEISGDSVLVFSPEVSSPVAVRYAFAMNPEGCSLYNKEGLPASPFRTDTW